MAGKIQKRYEDLQNKRGGRRRPPVALRPFTPAELAERNLAVAASMGGFESSFGRGRAEEPAETPAEPWRRKYRKKGERPHSEAKAKVAAARPRDAKGHFVKRARP